MSSPTKEQLQAINTNGKNIIVSAGAGSGKTFVLKERVLKTIRENTTLDKLIILTFTKNAANEMKNRIKKIISENSDVREQMPLIDSAYITTFDSYSQSIVKKYNYLLGIDKNFKIINSNLVDIEITKILDEILLDYYKNSNKDFDEMINNYCYKNDEELKKCLKNMYHKIVNMIDINDFLDNYLSSHYSDTYINNLIKEYENMIFAKRDSLENLYDELLNISLSEKCINNNQEHVRKVLEASSLDELSLALKSKISSKYPGYYEDDTDELRKNINSIETSIRELLKYDINELVSQYKSTYTSVKVIIDIIKKLDDRINEFKKEHNSYEFIDISKLAIKLVKENEDVRNEIKNNTYEIMIDEYQDTNDIQEEFISYIENNNVYMVGDVKQSIYRFRNANPYIFKNKYDSYDSVLNKDALGYRIDLTSNFRSRKELINNINDLFSIIMTDDVGGASYKESHQMNSGNQSYIEYITDNNYDMEILSYENEDKSINNVEIESYIMANDILNRINRKEKIVKEINGKDELVEATYEDFCVLVDKSIHFETIKKIFEYKGIPTNIYKDLSIKEDDELYILKNLITLLIKIKEDNFDIDFKHAYMSIGRSYIYKIDDESLYKIYINDIYKDTDLYMLLKKISDKIDMLSNKEILTLLISEFDIINKLITVGDIQSRSAKLEYFINECDSLNKFGMDIYSMNDYFEELLKSDEDIKMSSVKEDGNAVKIMTIHGSKGLEFSYVYSPFLGSSFKPKKKDSLYFSNKYGFILPYNDGMLENTFVNSLYEYDELKESISEKIRLFYVDITRAREKFIMITDFNTKLNAIDDVNQGDVLNTKSYKDILSILKNKLSKYIKEIPIKELNITKEYLNIKDDNYKEKIDYSNDKIIVKDLKISKKIVESKRFSKSLSKIIDKNFKETLDFGTHMHYIFEVYDFKNDNIDDLNINDVEKSHVINFLNHPQTKNIKNAKCYKEHEIKYMKDGSMFHGFIDLLVEYDDHFDIIDYKLSNVESPEYKNQLNGYKEYIERKYKKPTYTYLYSIKKDIFKDLN